MENRATESVREETLGGTRKPYRTPELTVYGDLKEITLGRFGGTTDGANLGGSVAVPSDRGLKENFSPVDGSDVLARLAGIPIETWNYRGEDPAVRHIGPMAQDFSSAFGVGHDDRHIHVVDASGVALAAIQALQERLSEQESEIRRLRAAVEALGTGGPR